MSNEKQRKTVHWRADVTTPKSNDLPKRNPKTFPKEKFSAVKEIQSENHPDKISENSPRQEAHDGRTAQGGLWKESVYRPGDIEYTRENNSRVQSEGNVQPISVSPNAYGNRADSHLGNSYRNDLQRTRAVTSNPNEDPHTSVYTNAGSGGKTYHKQSNASADVQTNNFQAINSKLANQGEYLHSRARRNSQNSYQHELTPTVNLARSEDSQSAVKESKHRNQPDLRTTPRSPGDGSSHDSLLLDNPRNFTERREKLPVPAHVSTLSRKPENDSIASRLLVDNPTQLKERLYDTYDQKSEFDLRTPRAGDKKSEFDLRTPRAGDKKSDFDLQTPRAGDKKSEFDLRTPRAGDKKSDFDLRTPRAGDKKSDFDLRTPRAGDKKSDFDLRTPRAGDKKSEFERTPIAGDKKSEFDIRTSRIDVKKSDSDLRTPRAVDRKSEFEGKLIAGDKNSDFGLRTPRSDVYSKGLSDRIESYERSSSKNVNNKSNTEQYTRADNGQAGGNILTQEKVRELRSRNQSGAFSRTNNGESKPNYASVSNPQHVQSNQPLAATTNLPKLRDYLGFNESPTGVLGRGQGVQDLRPAPGQNLLKPLIDQTDPDTNRPQETGLYVGNTYSQPVQVRPSGESINEVIQVNNTPSPMEQHPRRDPRVSQRSDMSQAEFDNTGRTGYFQESPYIYNQNEEYMYNQSSNKPRPIPRARGTTETRAEDSLLHESASARRKLFNTHNVNYNPSLDTGSESELQELYEDSDADIYPETNVEDIYLCYLVTDDGATIGPLRLDIDSVDIGLPPSSSGLRNRQSGSHSQNEFSSRSHSMLTLNLDTDVNYPDDDNLYVTKRGKLSFVDLAGSEKVKDSVTGETLLESNSINKSLLVLGNCISSLGNPKRREGHIPYRDSKLTKLLADSLGGNGVTLMIACVTPSSNNTMETMNTLRYANRAKKIKSKPVVKMDPREKLILTLKREIKVLRNENHYLRQQLEFPAKPKGQLQKENDERLVQFMKQQKQKPGGKPNTAQSDSGLYEMLQEYMVENESLRAENSDLQSSKDRLRREQQLLYRENDKLMKRMDALEKTVLGNPGPLSFRMSPVSLAHSAGLSSYENSPLHSPSPQQRKNSKVNSRSSSLGANGAIVSDGAEPGYVGSPNGRRPQGQMKPPHRLSEPVMRSTQGNQEPGRGTIHPAQMGPVQPPDGYVMPPPQGHAIPAYQSYSTHQPPGPGSPRLAKKASPPKVGGPRSNNSFHNKSEVKDDLQDMNEKLKRELAELEGEIKQQQQLQRAKSNYYGGPGVR